MDMMLQGTIHGRTIELDASPGIADGHRVELILRLKKLPGPPSGWSADGTETAAGMLAATWTEDDDRVLEEIRQRRKRGNARKVPE
jgi:hypothetical protein